MRLLVEVLFVVALMGAAVAGARMEQRTGKGRENIFLEILTHERVKKIEFISQKQDLFASIPLFLPNPNNIFK